MGQLMLLLRSVKMWGIDVASIGIMSVGIRLVGIDRLRLA